MADKIFKYIKDYAKTKGIVSLEVGTLQEETGTWKTVQRICHPSIIWLHPLISDIFKKKFMGKQPINYLYDSWNDSVKEDEIITYSFNNEGCINDDKKKLLASNETEYCNYSLIDIDETETNSHPESESKTNSHPESKIEEVTKILESVIENNPPVSNQSDQSSQEPLDQFIEYQEIFTKLVLASFNSVLPEDEWIKYVTIVLLRKKYDGKWHLSYNAVIFSNNLAFINHPSINLLFDCISHENYDNEIAALKQNVLRESIRSAISAIMSRNMSHNLGSHFITNTKNYFAQKVRHLEQLKKDGSNDFTIESVAKDYRGNVAMLQYLQERMDFIATVVSGDKYPYGSLNFKSQLYDILTEDDHGARHGKESQNFLLKYLVFSEKLTRGDELVDGFRKVKLRVKYIPSDNSEFIFTGEEHNQRTEENAKLALSKLNLAVPGGLMARHAFFSIFENIIRNSAKHSKNDSDLEVTIQLSLRESLLTISVYDNRGDIKAKDTVENHLRNLCIVDENNTINKESKGLKEILTCILWLKNSDVADVLTKIQSISDGEDKLKAIEEYMKVSTYREKDDEKENLCYEFSLPVFTPHLHLSEGTHYSLTSENLIEFINNNQILKEYHADIVSADEDYGLYVTPDRKLSDIFPRFVSKPESDVQTDLMKRIHADYFEKVIGVNSTKFANQSLVDGKGNIVVEQAKENEDNWDILFYDHFHTKTLAVKLDILSKLKGRYMESVSGENFTSTIATKEFLEDSIARYKTIEAALSRIVIIDERIYGDYKQRQKDITSNHSFKDTGTPDWWDETNGFEKLYEVLLKNFSIVPVENVNSVLDMESLNGSSDRTEQSKINELKRLVFPPRKIDSEYDALPDSLKGKASKIEQMILEAKNIYLFDFNSDYSGFVDLSDSIVIQQEIKDDSFLTIHLGQIEKYKNNYIKENREKYKLTHPNEKESDIIKVLTSEALSKCMELLKDKFHPKFISVHSGRGNYSPELSAGLRDYPFMSLSALEAALYNCKYFLSELFHNTNYYGKGNLNNKSRV